MSNAYPASFGRLEWTGTTPQLPVDLNRLREEIDTLALEITPVGQITAGAWFDLALKRYGLPITSNLAILDGLHTVAEKAFLVTPFSSYIALVNEQQQQNLEWAEEQYNRYDELPMQTEARATVPQPPGLPLRSLSPFMGVDIMDASPRGMGSSVSMYGGGGNLGMAVAESFISAGKLHHLQPSSQQLYRSSPGFFASAQQYPENKQEMK